MRAAIQRVGAGFDALLDQSAALPRTLAHGDFRLDNMFFTGDSARPLVMIDWQLSLRAHGPGDLTHCLSMSLETEVRRRHEQELLDLYHETLVTAGVAGCSREDLALNCRRGLLGGLVLGLAVANLDTANARGVLLFTTLIKRLMAALVDHRAWELLP